ncbi:MAG: methyltransferase, partial [Chitinophagales bacterium]|nr:methyltransferase [Chitinophagales bacterium]
AGLEPVLAAELQKLGADNVQNLHRAGSFEADNYMLYAANMHLRTALHILKPLIHFSATNEHELYDHIYKTDWTEYLTVDKTFAIDNAVHSQWFNHSLYAALKMKDAIADHFRDKFDKRPSVDTENPDIKFHLHIQDEKITISLDSSGTSLHKRGYREFGHHAPLNEVLAAGMIYLSGWDKHSTLFDPMCGSGTILIEGALIANEIAPCLIRNEYAFKKWDDFDPILYKQILLEAAAQVKDKKIIITGSDNDRKSIDMARKNAERAKLENKINFFAKPFDLTDPPKVKGMVIMNPPYGERLKNEDMNAFYKEIGDAFKKKYHGYTAWILSANKEAVKNIGLRTSRKIALYNGPLECRFLRYDMYEGSKKINKDPEILP